MSDQMKDNPHKPIDVPLMFSKTDDFFKSSVKAVVVKMICPDAEDRIPSQSVCHCVRIIKGMCCTQIQPYLLYAKCIN